MGPGTIDLAVAHGTHRIFDPVEKLLARGALPGAYGFDLGAHALRMARAKGVAPMALLACAMPGSWMVNNRAPSPVFRAWLSPPRVEAWAALYELLSGGPEAWLSRSSDDRSAVTECVRALCIEGHGVAAVSKVLAYWIAESVLLMDDAMLSLALGTVPEPSTADDPKAGAEHFVPAMDWFCKSVLSHEDTLIQVVREYPLAPFDCSQALDRLLWVESWGWRLRIGQGPGVYARVRDGARSGILRVDGSALAANVGLEALSDAQRERWTSDR